MPAIDIENVSVEFPFQPYPAQVTYMEKVVEALNKRTNALLESPTGTGKTLSLLCSTLAWQQSYSPDKDNAAFAAAGGCCGGGGGGGGSAKAASNGGGGMALRYETDSTSLLSRPPLTNGGGIGLKAGVGFLPGPQGKPVIVYASRTHSQLTQVVRELKATTYRPRTVILGSREQLCVHPEVSKLKGGLQNRRCGVLVGNRSCRYKNNLDSFQVDQAGGLGGPGVMDIEELSELGRTKLVRKGRREGGTEGCLGLVFEASLSKLSRK
jgi:regulator of telomere elongation helicase 1